MSRRKPRKPDAREHPSCRHPDRDAPKMMCGYPLPCPWHTAVINLDADPPTVTIPVTSDAMKHDLMRARLGQIARALAAEPKEGSECPYHRALPYAPLDRTYRYDAASGEFVRVPIVQ